MNKLIDAYNFFLIEDKVQNLKSIYVDTHKLPEHIFDRLIEIDPSPTKKYLQWMVLRYIKERSIGGTMFDTLATIIPQFHELAQRRIITGAAADIGQYKTVESLIDVLAQYETKADEAYAKSGVSLKNPAKDVKPEDIVFENDKVVIVNPKNTLDSQKYGHGAGWCTRAEDDAICRFNQYFFSHNTNLYYILPKDGRYNNTDWKKVAIEVQPDKSKIVWSYSNKSYSMKDEIVKSYFDELGIPISK